MADDGREPDDHSADGDSANMGIGLGVALGLCLGTGVSIVFDNWALLGFGLLGGILVGLAYDHRNARPEDGDG
ncbi:hypothetical protein [Pseudonocardia sp. NPDC049635]|uniref:hypothetical protein n=1 Tax=Pseudonocardia sp. NPDC049635 TaxID=3155506 RepID=UPI003406FF4F